MNGHADVRSSRWPTWGGGGGGERHRGTDKQKVSEEREELISQTDRISGLICWITGRNHLSCTPSPTHDIIQTWGKEVRRWGESRRKRTGNRVERGKKGIIKQTRNKRGGWKATLLNFITLIYSKRCLHSSLTFGKSILCFRNLVFFFTIPGFPLISIQHNKPNRIFFVKVLRSVFITIKIAYIFTSDLMFVMNEFEEKVNKWKVLLLNHWWRLPC